MDENKFTKIDKILPIVLKAAGLEERLKGAGAISLWPEVVGDKVASVTRAVKLEKGVLHVQVGHSAWMQELHFMEKKLVRELNARVPEAEIKRIRFILCSINSFDMKG